MGVLAKYMGAVSYELLITDLATGRTCLAVLTDEAAITVENCLVKHTGERSRAVATGHWQQTWAGWGFTFHMRYAGPTT